MEMRNLVNDIFRRKTKRERYLPASVTKRAYSRALCVNQHFWQARYLFDLAGGDDGAL